MSAPPGDAVVGSAAAEPAEVHSHSKAEARRLQQLTWQQRALKKLQHSMLTWHGVKEGAAELAGASATPNTLLERARRFSMASRSQLEVTAYSHQLMWEAASEGDLPFLERWAVVV